MSSQNSSADEIENSVVHVLAKVLMKLIEANEANGLHLLQAHAHAQMSAHGSAATGSAVSKFQSSCVPDVSVAAYLLRIRKYAKCSDACFVIALIYIDRIIELKSIVLTRLNIHRLLIAAVQVAAKYLDDLFYNNAFYAKLGGVSTQEMNTLELEFLMMIGFSLHVKETVFNAYFAELKCYNTANTQENAQPNQVPVQVQMMQHQQLHQQQQQQLLQLHKPGMTACIPSVVSSNCLAGGAVDAAGMMVGGAVGPVSPVGVDYFQPSPMYDMATSNQVAVHTQAQLMMATQPIITHPRPSSNSPTLYCAAPRKRSSSIVTPPLSASYNNSVCSSINNSINSGVTGLSGLSAHSSLSSSGGFVCANTQQQQHPLFAVQSVYTLEQLQQAHAAQQVQAQQQQQQQQQMLYLQQQQQQAQAQHALHLQSSAQQLCYSYEEMPMAVSGGSNGNHKMFPQQPSPRHMHNSNNGYAMTYPNTHNVDGGNVQAAMSFPPFNHQQQQMQARYVNNNAQQQQMQMQMQHQQQQQFVHQHANLHQNLQYPFANSGNQFPYYYVTTVSSGL
jgi:hypothetical protein